MDQHFILLHYTTKEDWWLCVEHINAIRNNHDKEEVKPADKGFPVIQYKYDRLQEYTAQELVDHLRFQGWEVTCAKTIKL